MSSEAPLGRMIWTPELAAVRRLDMLSQLLFRSRGVCIIQAHACHDQPGYLELHDLTHHPPSTPDSIDSPSAPAYHISSWATTYSQYAHTGLDTN
jgi:hypothetical protein